MGINFSKLVYLPQYDFWAVPITVNPLVSQPGQPVYGLRGIFRRQPLDIIAEDGSRMTQHQTELDIREADFAVLPLQGDHITVPADCNDVNQGTFEVLDSNTNGGGETTLTLRQVMVPRP